MSFPVAPAFFVKKDFEKVAKGHIQVADIFYIVHNEIESNECDRED